MATPVLIPTASIKESFAGVSYRIEGELVPVLHIELDSVPIYFEHHVLLWKSPAVEIGLKSLKGAFKRLIAGMPILMTEAKGHGGIAFSRDGPGQIISIHFNSGESIDVREHQFLAATEGIDFTFNRVKGFSNILFGGSGLFIDSFTCQSKHGILWLHGYGNIFEVVLKDGERIDIEPGGWIYKERQVRMETIWTKLSSGLFGSSNLNLNRFTGPGKVGIQSMYLHMPEPK